MYVYKHVLPHTRIYVYIVLIYVLPHTYVYTYVCVYTYVYTCVCISFLRLSYVSHFCIFTAPFDFPFSCTRVVKIFKILGQLHVVPYKIPT